ncbi:hypothetical protein [Escherichia sp. E10V4]|uniref:MrpH family fimbial adhesin n=1 Tax=Escherichia sp. E10V4 TaxID=2478971 RepID=UPI0010377E83|nr:hypothetical protein [Escherichia sp. E10V4]TBR66637.1 hypothetical protein D9737_14200 [Escherichia sp. E10V4]
MSLKRFFVFFFLCFFSDISHATMFGYLGDSNLSEVMEGSVDIPAFVKQGDIVTIQAKTKKFSYGARWVLSSEYNTCDYPYKYPKVFEVVEWPRKIETSNAVLTLVYPESGFGISTRPSVRQCHTYISENEPWKPAWEITATGNAYKAQYRVSKITAAKTENIIVHLRMGSGRSELSEDRIVNEMRKYSHTFGGINLNIPVAVKTWCSSSFSDGEQLVLSHGILKPSEINGNSQSKAIILRCEGSDGEFNLSWGNGGNVNTPRKIELKQGVESSVSVKGTDESGKVSVLADTNKNITITSVLKAKGNVMAGEFSGGDVLIISFP